MTTLTPGKTRSAPALSRAAWAVMTLLAAAIALPSYRYLAHIGPVPRNIAANHHLTPWIVIHATGSATALLLGPFQFLSALRRRTPAIHRWIGRLYIASVALGGLSALILATGVSTGPIAGSGFFALGLAWLAVTAAGLVAARNRRFIAHRSWMIRSYALSLAAVTLRIYLPLSFILGASFPANYRAIAWLCWLPNAAIAELLLARQATRPRPEQQQSP